MVTVILLPNWEYGVFMHNMVYWELAKTPNSVVLSSCKLCMNGAAREYHDDYDAFIKDIRETKPTLIVLYNYSHNIVDAITDIQRALHGNQYHIIVQVQLRLVDASILERANNILVPNNLVDIVPRQLSHLVRSYRPYELTLIDPGFLV